MRRASGLSARFTEGLHIHINKKILHIVIPILFTLVFIIVLLALSDQAKGEHKSEVEACDYSDGDRILNHNDTIVLGINISNNGNTQISNLKFHPPEGFTITGWSTAAAPESKGTEWFDDPDVDGNPGLTTGGNFTPTTNTLTLSAMWEDNITAGNYEYFILYINTANADRDVFTLVVETIDNQSASLTHEQYFAVTATYGPYDICIDLRDWDQRPINASHGQLLLPQSYLNPGTEGMDTKFNEFPDLINAQDAFALDPVNKGGLILWRDGTEFFSSATAPNYNITDEAWGDDAFIFIEPADAINFSSIKINMSDYTAGYNGLIVSVDGVINTHVDSLHNVESMYFSTASGAFHKAWVEIVGMAGGTHTGTAYYTDMPMNNSEAYTCSETGTGTGVYHWGVLDFNSDPNWGDLVHGSSVRIEADLTGDGQIICHYIEIDALDPVIDEVEIERNDYVWYSGSEIWYQNNMTQWDIQGFVNLSFHVTEEHLLKAEGSYAFKEMPDDSIEGPYVNISYTIDGLNDEASSLSITIYDRAGNNVVYTIACQKDNTPPGKPVIVDVEYTSPYIYYYQNQTMDILYYRNNINPMNAQFNLLFLDIEDNPGGCGFWKVVGSEAFNGTPRDSVISDGLAISYHINYTYTGGTLTITAYDKVSNNISVEFTTQLDNNAPTIYPWLEYDSPHLYYDLNAATLYYSNDQPMNAVLDIKILSQDLGSGLDLAIGSLAFDEGPSHKLVIPMKEARFNLKYVVSTNETAPSQKIILSVYDKLGNEKNFKIDVVEDNQGPTSVSLRDLTEQSPYIYFKEGTLYYSNQHLMNHFFSINLTAEDLGAGLDYAQGPDIFNQTNPGKNIIRDDDYDQYFRLLYFIDTYEEGGTDINISIFDRVANPSYLVLKLVLDNGAPITSDNAPADWISTQAVIKLKESDNSGGVGITETYYTLDGSEPDFNSSTYSHTIIIRETGQYTLKYFSIDFVGNVQPVQVAPTIKIDKLLPEITSGPYIEPENLTSQTTGSVAISVSLIDYGGSGINENWVMFDYHLSGKEYLGYRLMSKAGYKYYFTLDEDWWAYGGLKLYWKFSIKDVAGNYYNTTEYVEQIDYIPKVNFPPVVEVLSPVGGEYWTGERSIRWFAQDPEGDSLDFEIWVSWDGGVSYLKLEEDIPGDMRSWTWNTSTMTHSQGEMVYRLKIIAKEIVGGKQAESESRLFSIFHPKPGDDHPPDVELLYPLGGETLYGPTEIRWKARDPEYHGLRFNIYLIMIYENGTMEKVLIQGDIRDPYRSVLFDPDDIVFPASRAVENGSKYRIMLVAWETNGSIPWKIEIISDPIEIHNPGIFENHPPSISLISPSGDTEVHLGEDLIVSWHAEDADGGDTEQLTYTIYLSLDGGHKYVPLAEDLAHDTTYWKGELDETDLYSSDHCRIKVMVLDGHSQYGTSMDVSELFRILPPREDDWDGDGIPNWWELYYGLDPYDPDDAGQDWDKDGLTNLEEYQRSTNPLEMDTDGDHMPDGWEVAHGLDPRDGTDAEMDPDMDGYTNLQEYLNYTDPQDPESHPEPLEEEISEEEDGWLLVTLLALLVTLVLMAVLHITRPSEWEMEPEMEREVEDWVRRLRRSRPIVREKEKKKVVTKKVLKKIRKLRKGEKEKEKKVPSSKKPVNLYISEKAFKKLLTHCYDYAEERKEVMGLMVGDRYKWKGAEYTRVDDVVTTDLDSSSVYVRFNREGFEALFEELDKLPKDYIIVGWYHSHPGHTTFLSATDIRTQEAMFNQDFHSAVVVDPINVQMQAFGVKDGRSYYKSFAIYK